MMTFLTDMNALFRTFHNSIILLTRGQDNVCNCTCGRQQVHHVVAYNESMMDSREKYVLNDSVAQQQIYMVTGLIVGLFLSYVLLWLDRVRVLGFKYRRAYQMKNAQIQKHK